jgi:hypothetical protein
MRRLLWVVAVTGLGCGSASPLPDATAVLPGDGPASGPEDGGAGTDAPTGVLADTGVDAGGADGAAADATAAADLAAPTDQAAPADSATPAALAIDTSAFIFGPTPRSCESTTAAVLTVSNLGGAASAPLHVGLEGAFPDRFRVEKDECSGRPLAAGASCVVQVRFAPKQLMDEPATADLVVKGAEGERAATSLAGESNVDNFDVFPLMAGLLDFQTVKVGVASASQEDVWTNNTDFPATPTVPMLMGTNAEDFTIVGDTCAGKSIPARQTCRIAVRMTPRAAGQRFATIKVSAAGACGYDFTDMLTLVGVGE